jgi:hypothetical protein
VTGRPVYADGKVQVMGDKGMTTTARPRLTPHQTEVLGRLTRYVERVGHAIRESNIGSPGALRHLERKGYIKVDHVEYGGQYRWWTLV